jgi:hypothetical protein
MKILKFNQVGHFGMLELILRGESKCLKAHQLNDSRASREITSI